MIIYNEKSVFGAFFSYQHTISFLFLENWDVASKNIPVAIIKTPGG